MGADVRRVLAEGLGTGILVATVVGSGIMGTTLSKDLGVALLANAGATVGVLGLLIWMIGPISGAHFNPVVSLVAVVRGSISVGMATAYSLAQIVGALVGASIANVMFDLAPVLISTHSRTGPGLWLGEVVATAGLLLTIGALERSASGGVGAVIVPAWIFGAYFFTSSTSFANPAVTIGRSISDTFAGIAPESVAAFIGAQVVGAAIGALTATVLFPSPKRVEVTS